MSDSERIAGDYQARGYKEARNWREASEIVVNTCAVRQRAEDRVSGFLLNVVEYFDSRQQPKPKIILTGCMTHHGQSKILEFLPMVDEVLPVNEVGFNVAAIRRDKVHAWVPISSGCNSFCTYCIVPYARGRERSRSEAEILTEIENLVKNGYTQITLLGQNVNSWGLEKAGIGYRKLLMSHKEFTLDDIPDNQSQYFKPEREVPFVRLLQKISSFPQIEKISFVTSNPWDFWDELIDEIAANQKIDRFIHLPVQSGSNRVLRLMNRGYTAESYRELVKKLREKIPGVSLGTDIIVGFPGETEEDFQETVELAKDVDWKIAFVAKYSPRPGTGAWRMYKDDVSPADKKRRWQILEDIINQPHLHERPIVPKEKKA